MKKYIFTLVIGFLTIISTAKAQIVPFNTLNGTGGTLQSLVFNPAVGYGYRIYSTAPVSGKAQLRFSTTNDVSGTYNDAMVINTDGRVGIGTVFATAFPTSGGYSEHNEYRLFVKDGIRTEKVKVDIGIGTWGDFVFRPKYDLMPLTELQNYVRTHQHLPSIPSAAEVEKQGLNLGEMQRLQMIKIEELTLYLLELKKENDQLRERVEKLEKK